MTECVAEVEQGAAGALALIGPDNRRLHFHAAANGVGQRGRVARQHLGRVGLQPGEERPIAEQAVFDHFGIAAHHFARRQAGQRVEVGQHQSGLMKGADQILAARRVDGGLAADRRIHLRQQGRRDLDEVDAALVDRRGEARQIADHAAAEGDHNVGSL